jgi:RimJ/RimL family protein N-acetyltransferase
MRIIEGTEVDLIAPYPLSEAKRIVGWTHCYRSMVTVDNSPSTDEELTAYTSFTILNNPTWAVVDKANKLGYKHEAPLIGVYYLEPGSTPANTYIHFVSSRKAFGSGLMQEGGTLVISDIFSIFPSLARISAGILHKNAPARYFLKALGFKQDGLFRDFVTQKNIPQKLAHFGFLRSEQWAASATPLPNKDLKQEPTQQDSAILS